MDQCVDPSPVPFHTFLVVNQACTVNNLHRHAIQISSSSQCGQAGGTCLSSFPSIHPRPFRFSVCETLFVGIGCVLAAGLLTKAVVRQSCVHAMFSPTPYAPQQSLITTVIRLPRVEMALLAIHTCRGLFAGRYDGKSCN